MIWYNVLLKVFLEDFLSAIITSSSLFFFVLLFHVVLSLLLTCFKKGLLHYLSVYTYKKCNCGQKAILWVISIWSTGHSLLLLLVPRLEFIFPRINLSFYFCLSHYILLNYFNLVYNINSMAFVYLLVNNLNSINRLCIFCLFPCKDK